eukprot:10494340-Ditylum_brightwellii.AAC.1
MSACKLGGFKGNNGFNADKDAWQSFLIINHLDANYFDKMKYTDCRKWYNPMAQFKNGGIPPRRCVCSLIEKN